MTWYVVTEWKDLERAAKERVWTVSEDPTEPGWENDSGQQGYGLTKAQADSIVGMQDTISEMQKVIDALHDALWMALQLEGGEIVVTVEEAADMPPRGQIEWLENADGSVRVIRGVADQEKAGCS